ncbi:MAG: POTRA domain-containing protein, partial [Deltaproteobacteria bacterium]|nr:POTRA domain-containing protein [Deltaproteobacteria bacterium]
MPKKSVILAFLLLFPFSKIYADARIVDIDFKGLIKVEETDLRRRISSMEGGAYSPALIDRDIKTLFGTGLFADIEVSVTEIAGGVRIVFQVL